MFNDVNFKCPYCKNVLHFDIHDRKHHCDTCNGIFTFSFDFDEGTFTITEWAVEDRSEIK